MYQGLRECEKRRNVDVELQSFKVHKSKGRTLFVVDVDV
jgi:hypothetical protein